MKKITYILFIALFTLGLSSCEKFLEQDLQQSVDVSNAINNLEDGNSADHHIPLLQDLQAELGQVVRNRHDDRHERRVPSGPNKQLRSPRPDYGLIHCLIERDDGTIG